MTMDSEFQGEVDRASTVVRDQIAALIDAARGEALAIERGARDADDERRRVDERADAMLKHLHGVESELSLLIGHVGREAAALQAELDRSRLRAPGEAPGASPGQPDTAAKPEADDTRPAGPAPDRQTASEPDTVEVVPDAEVEVAEAPAAAAAGGGTDLDAEARTRVAAKTDLELAELHALADGKSTKGNEEERAYWSSLRSAAVEEAVSRREFGQIGEGSDSGGRRAKKKRAKALQPLTAARDTALREAERE